MKTVRSQQLSAEGNYCRKTHRECSGVAECGKIPATGCLDYGPTNFPQRWSLRRNLEFPWSGGTVSRKREILKCCETEFCAGNLHLILISHLFSERFTYHWASEEQNVSSVELQRMKESGQSAVHFDTKLARQELHLWVKKVPLAVIQGYPNTSYYGSSLRQRRQSHFDLHWKAKALIFLFSSATRYLNSQYCFMITAQILPIAHCLDQRAYLLFYTFYDQR